MTFTHSFCFIYLCLSVFQHGLALTPVSELEALLSLHSSAFGTAIWEDVATSGRIWEFESEDIESESFNQTNPCGSSDDETWQGIICTEPPTACRDNSTTICSIVSLDVESLNLTGALTHDLDQLSMLTKLTLGNNHMSGTIPPTLGNLSNLKVSKWIDVMLLLAFFVFVPI